MFALTKLVTLVESVVSWTIKLDDLIVIAEKVTIAGTSLSEANWLFTADIFLAQFSGLLRA